MGEILERVLTDIERNQAARKLTGATVGGVIPPLSRNAAAETVVAKVLQNGAPDVSFTRPETIPPLSKRAAAQLAEMDSLEERNRELERQLSDALARAHQLETNQNALRADFSGLQIKYDSLLRNYERAMAALNLMDKAIQQMKDLEKPI